MLELQIKLYPLFKSSKILDIISVAKTFNTLPSDVVGIDKEDSYFRYCFDEACTYIYSKMQPDKDGNCVEPVFEETRKSTTQRHSNPGLELLMKEDKK